MITKEEVLQLLSSTETYRIERTTSIRDMDKFQEAICAFSNDLPNSRKKGYLIIGAYDDGSLSGLKVDDNLLKNISSIRCLSCRWIALNIMMVTCWLLRCRPRLCLQYATVAALLFALAHAVTLLQKPKNAFSWRNAPRLWRHSMLLLASLQKSLT